MPTRRQTLIGIGGVAAGVTAASALRAAPARADGSTDRQDEPQTGAVDVHAHYVTPAYRQALIEAGHEQPDGMPGIPDWSPEQALEFMDSAHVASAVLSVSSPGFALDSLGADGVVLETNYEGVYLADAAGEALLAELDRRRAVVLLHPTSPACWEATALGRPRPVVEFLFDTTRAVMQLVQDGVTARYPGIDFIVPHTGAALPVLADRIASFATLEDGDPKAVLAALRNLHYDVAGFALPRALPALLNLVEPDRLLYGSDFPFTGAPVATALAARLAATDVLTPAEKRAMFSGNAARLFPRLAGRT